jgi:import inner membrane translocase subunit TIM21
VTYVLFKDVFSPNSKTAAFNRIVSLVKSNEDCIDILGPANRIVAYGETPRSSFRRARMEGPQASSKTATDAMGTEHLRMRFLVRGSKNEGWVSVHMARAKGNSEWEDLLVALDVKGHHRVYVVNDSNEPGKKKLSGNLFGVRLW